MICTTLVNTHADTQTELSIGYAISLAIAKLRSTKTTKIKLNSLTKSLSDGIFYTLGLLRNKTMGVLIVSQCNKV